MGYLLGMPSQSNYLQIGSLRVAAGQLGYLSILLAKAGRSLSPAALSGGTERGADEIPRRGAKTPRPACRLSAQLRQPGPTRSCHLSRAAHGPTEFPSAAAAAG